MGMVRIGRVAAVAGALAVGWCAAPVGAEGPQITDAVDDAYRYPASPVGQPEPKPPSPVLSNDAADIVSVTFAKAPPRLPHHDSGYSVSLTVAGAPHASYNYLIGGQFGEDCYLIHFFKAGETRPAVASCGSGEQFRHLGTIEGSKVTIKGDTITADFSFRRFTLHSRLKADPELDHLYSMSCPVTSQSWGCNDDVIDFGFADPATMFRI